MASSVQDSTNTLLICTACGTQFDETDRTVLTACRICDDPRQFVPPTGQSFTTLSSLKAATQYKNRFTPLACDSRLTSIWTEPKFGIGQRCIFIQTSTGNILWDCITYLDSATIEWIKSHGGLAAIVISHPHYYTTHLLWAAVFQCPVYLAWEDKDWLCREDSAEAPVRVFHDTDDSVWDIPGVGGKQTGVKALKLGGHFPGSLVCLFAGRLLIADTLVSTPSGMGNWKEKKRPQGMNSFAFMWSIPNMIPLPPDELAKMWNVLKHHEFKSTHGAFVGMEIVSDDVKSRVLESMKIQVRGEGYSEHVLLRET